MKHCAHFRKQIALAVAAAEFDVGQETLLRQHLASCTDCREYSEEMTTLCRHHRSAALALPEVSPSSKLIFRVSSALRECRLRKSPRWIPGILLSAARPRYVVAALVVGISFGWFLRPRPGRVDRPDPSAAVEPAPDRGRPTLLAYRRAFDQSQDALDMLLTQAAPRRGVSPGETPHLGLTQAFMEP